MLVRTTLSFCLCGGSEDKDNEAFCSISGMTKKKDLYMFKPEPGL